MICHKVTDSFLETALWEEFDNFTKAASPLIPLATIQIGVVIARLIAFETLSHFKVGTSHRIVVRSVRTVSPVGFERMKQSLNWSFTT